MYCYSVPNKDDVGKPYYISPSNTVVYLFPFDCQDCRDSPIQVRFKRYSMMSMCEKHSQEMIDEDNNQGKITSRLPPDYWKDQLNWRQQEYLKKLKIQHQCECGGRYVYSNKSLHYKTLKHQAYLNTLD